MRALFPGPNYRIFAKVLQHDRNNQTMDIDWEAEWDNLSNKSWVTEGPGPKYTEDGSGIPEVIGPVLPLILYKTTVVR